MKLMNSLVPLSVSPLHLICAFLAAFVAGGINSVAGGGSMISFPILIALGLPPLFANATNTVGIWPGAIGSLFGFRREFEKVPKNYLWIAIPALVGSIGGAFLLRWTSPETFEKIVPGLLLFSTVLFIVAPEVRKRLKLMPSADGQGTARWSIVVPLQLMVSIYGGYFGAGMSILMLSILSLMGMTDMLVMNALTSLLSLVINGAAGVVFIVSGLISWPIALAMAVGAILGGYFAAGIARKVGSEWIRRLVIAVGLALAVVMLIKVLRGS